MAKGMVITVGVGRGIEHAIVLSIRNAHPDYVVFLVTEQSEKTLERIEEAAKELGVTIPPYEKEKVRDENNAEVAFEAAVAAIRKLGEKGIAPSEITVDYTTGSKPMSAGALYAAITEGCADVVYVTGERDQDGRVILGMERFFTIVPDRLFARRIRIEAVRLFNAYQFAAAKSLLDEFLKPFPQDKVGQLFPDLDGLRKLCDAYRAWDAFDHIAAKQAFDEVNRAIMEQWSPDDQIACNKGWVNRLARKLQADKLDERLCEELLVDLWANALRRLEEKRFIDAVARLYRLAELIAQFRLWHGHKIDTSDVDMSKVPESVGEKLERYRSEKGKVQIPLKASYELLSALGDEVGRVLEQQEFKNALSSRNDSIAAHGLKPVTEEVATKLKEAIKPLLEKVVPRLSSLLNEAKFPCLKP
ncbi:MAG: hypothetical protein BKPUNTRY_001747 [Candidatus Fervidibacter sp.]